MASRAYQEKYIIQLAKDGKDQYEIRDELFGHWKFPPSIRYISYVLRIAGLK